MPVHAVVGFGKTDMRFVYVAGRIVPAQDARADHIARRASVPQPEDPAILVMEQVADVDALLLPGPLGGQNRVVVVLLRPVENPLGCHLLLDAVVVNEQVFPWK